VQAFPIALKRFKGFASFLNRSRPLPPGLLPKGPEEAAVTAEAGDVLTALIRLLPPELRASIEREAAEDAAPLTRH
jgi:hypothetical protein